MEKAHDLSSPFTMLISFHKLLEILETIANSDVDYRSNYAKALLAEVAKKPEIRQGTQDVNFIEEHKDLIKNLLADLFPTALTHNEIKAAALPFRSFTFNYSERFKKIINEAGFDFDYAIRDFDENQLYIVNCILILNYYYKQNLDFGKPLFYDIPDAQGILKHYRILYNIDFVEISPKDDFKHLTQETINELVDNFEDVARWKKHFPPDSWLLKGFVIMSLVDVTVESAVSNLKSNLLKPYSDKSELSESFESIFRSVFKIADLRIGFTLYNEDEQLFVKPAYKQSFILLDQEQADCKNVLCGYSHDFLAENNKAIIIPNVEEFIETSENQNLGCHLLKQGIHSCILAPVMKNNKLLGIVELGSAQNRALNSVNANKLELIMPFIVDTIERSNTEIQNQIEAIIQKEYTAIHSSVYWKFKKEAMNYVQQNMLSKDYIFEEITFKNVFPLYGQIDIKGSSEHRNETVKTDLKNQLQSLISIFDEFNPNSNLLILEQQKFELNEFLSELDQPLKTHTEQQIQRFIENEIHPLLETKNITEACQIKVAAYFENLDPVTGMFYQSRKDFDNTLFEINKKLARVIDEKQQEAQQIFPHYYERFKTDGVEHNLYIGSSIAPNLQFDKIYLNNLRLWQLQTLCEMEMEHHKIKNNLPYPLEVTSLILVFNTSISIRFRMDEKRFDVDGSYNARYEVIKKRIDKAHIKDTEKRITEKEKITIVYSQKHKEEEYMKYIKFLQHKKVIDKTIEKFDVEDLQGISGLKGLRVKVSNNFNENKYSYQDLLNELK